MKHLANIFASLVLLVISSCSKDDDNNTQEASFKEAKIDLITHKLASFSIINNSKYLIVFESGLGDDHKVWKDKSVANNIAKSSDVLLYDRAGYGKSDINNEARTISKLRTELESVINKFSNGRKVILVGHSLGGMIIRDYAIQNPTKTAALLFVDASHELYNNPDQAEEDLIYNLFKDAYGNNFGGTLEAQQLIEDSQYMTTLPNLPNIPVIAITSMKIDAEHNADDRQLWFNSKEALRNGITDFTHITTTKSGHYVMLSEPNLIITNIQMLLSKLP
ncbi:MAG: alpha/beta hydrolase [Flavobacterium sp.]|uniref:alpha/beta fold hydrolase n=1 Tax=Flavobacterium sp. TaxID=239 RepID=UPI0022C093B6|nr:alpha/beta hydrolase [Flavobacterium sp.]MCZ8196510.1 alpha/beta hydrolase [Flavobacterium sp.]